MSAENRKNWRSPIQSERGAVELRVGEQPVVAGQLVNVSAGGFAATFPPTVGFETGAEAVLETCDGRHLVRIQHVRPDGTSVSLGLQRVRDLARPKVPEQNKYQKEWRSSLDVGARPMFFECAGWLAFLVVSLLGLVWIGASLVEAAKERRGSAISFDYGWLPFGRTAQEAAEDIRQVQSVPLQVAPSRTNGNGRPQSDMPHDGEIDSETMAQSWQQALTGATAAIRRDPRAARSWEVRGRLWSQARAFDRAVHDYSEAARLDPQSVEAYLGQASVWAMAPQRHLRDGKRALEAALKACELSHWKLPRSLEALAAAYAETGRFEEAVHWQDEAVRLLAAQEAPDEELERARGLVDRYRNGLTFPEEAGPIAS